MLNNFNVYFYKITRLYKIYNAASIIYTYLKLTTII